MIDSGSERVKRRSLLLTICCCCSLYAAWYMLYKMVLTFKSVASNVVFQIVWRVVVVGGGVGGGRGVADSHLFTFFRLQNIVQCCIIFPFLLFPATFGNPLPTLSSPISHTPPVPLSPSTRVPRMSALEAIETVDVVLKRNHSIKSCWAVLAHGTVYYAVQDVSNFWLESVDVGLKRLHSNES